MSLNYFVNFIRLFISLIYLVILTTIELILFIIVLLFTDLLKKSDYLLFLREFYEGDIFPLYIFIWLISITLFTYFIYNYLYKKYKNEAHFDLIKKIVYFLFNIKMTSTKIKVEIENILKWNNITAFIITAYIVLVSVYYSSISEQDFERLGLTFEKIDIHINIIIFSLIFSSITLLNNYYSEKISDDNKRYEFNSRVDELLNNKVDKKIEDKLNEHAIEVVISVKPYKSVWSKIKKILNKKK